MKKLALCLLLLQLSACVMAPKKPVSSPDPDEIGEDDVPETVRREVVVNYDELQANLAFFPNREELGIHEKRFNTCDVGAGYPRSGQCMQRTLTVLNFRLQCRASEGTVSSVTEIELTSVSSSQVRWKLGLFSGVTSTDSDGYGQIRVVVPGTSRGQKVRLGYQENFLVMEANQLTRVVVPNFWCE